MARRPRTSSEASPAGKTRTREHVIASQSVAHVERFIAAAGHTAERFANDYGYDLNMFTYGQGGGLEPGSVLIQIKATDNLPLLQDGKTISFPIRRKDIALWRKEPMPVILVVHGVAQEAAYWLYVQEVVEAWVGSGATDRSTHVNLHLSTENVVNERAIERFREFKQTVLGQTEAIKHHG